MNKQLKYFLLSIVLALSLNTALFAQASSTGATAILQDAATATGNGSSLSTERWNGVRVKVTISATATVTFEVAADGTNFTTTSNAFNITDPSTAVSTATATGTFIVVTNGAPFRTRISSYGSGTVTTRATQIYLTVAKAVGGGSGVGSSSNGQVIINVSGLPSGDADLTFTTDTLTATKIIASTNITIGVGSAITSSGAGGALGTAAFVADNTLVHLAGAETITGAKVSSVNGAASTPPVTLTGTWFSGGSATTTKPQLLIEPTGTTTTNWSTDGTGLGVNAPTGFVGDLLNLQLTALSRFRVTSAGAGFFASRITGATDLVIGSGGTFGAGNNLGFLNSTTLYAASNGVLMISNAAQDDFSRLQFGGTTSGFPSLKRNGTALNLRLADDSADAPFTTGNLTIGAGTAITRHLSATATLDFANQAVAGCEVLTIAVTGAALGDTVAIGVPNGSNTANSVFWAWVSAADVVSIKHCAIISGDPASGSFRADVTKH